MLYKEGRIEKALNEQNGNNDNKYKRYV